MTDIIVEAIHVVRRNTCEECDYDFEKLGKHYMQLQTENPDRIRYTMPEEEHVVNSANAKQT